MGFPVHLCQVGSGFRVGFFHVPWKGTVDGVGHELSNKENSKHTVKKIILNL